MGWPDGRIRPLVFDGSPLLSSAVYADPAGDLLVGREVLALVQSDASRFEPCPKRQIDAGTVLLGDQHVPVAKLITAVLARVAQEAARVAGRPPDDVVLTYPAGWGPTRRAMLRTAAQSAGLTPTVMLAEPVAAAGYFLTAAEQPIPVGAPLMVYDLGGGTFDVSVVRRTEEGFEVIASDGLPDLGGADLDALVVDLVGQTVNHHDPQTWRRLTNPDTTADHRNFRALWDAARLAKETLSRRPVAIVAVPIAEREVHVTREQFEHAAAATLTLTTDLTQTMLRRAGLGSADLVGIFLVGGATRTPLVATLLHRATGRPPTVLDQPELVVAEGALHATPTADPFHAGAAGVAGADPPSWAIQSPVGSGNLPPFHPTSTAGTPAPPPPARAGRTQRTSRRSRLIVLIVAAALLLGAAVTVIAVALSQQSDSQLQPIAGNWQIARLDPSWTSTNKTAAMKIDANGKVTVTGGPPLGYGCTGTIRSTGDHKPYKITLAVGCDTGNLAAGSELDATLNATGDLLTITTTIRNAAPGTLTTSSWTRRN
ncbi:Hsp70 family protein [Dactylosporangium sp. McL0621]|uniref:Hsp70 family protein n=1 Tax=Dactylosporangium sp. McL0621 TaxID=3415678 RepID=UPI003CF190BE